MGHLNRKLAVAHDSKPKRKWAGGGIRAHRVGWLLWFKNKLHFFGSTLGNQLNFAVRGPLCF